jgi:hypothetical protein
MRLMPAGQWVAFEDDAAHNCAAPPKAKPTRKSGPHRVSPPRASQVDDDFGEFVLPHEKPTNRKRPIAESDVTKAAVPQPSVEEPASGPARGFRLPTSDPIAVGPRDPAPSRPTLPRAELDHPVPHAPPQDFRKWLLRSLAFILVVGLIKVVMREAAHLSLPATNFAPSTRSDVHPNPDGQISAPPWIKTLQTRPFGPDQIASTPTPATPGAAKAAADAAVIACIEQYASQDLNSGGDFMLGAYKATACEDHVRRIYPGTRGEPAPGEPYPYPPVDPRR